MSNDVENFQNTLFIINYEIILKNNTTIYIYRQNQYVIITFSVRNILTIAHRRANFHQPLKIPLNSSTPSKQWWEENRAGRLLYKLPSCSRWLSKTSVLTSKEGGRGGRCRGYKRGPSRCRFHCIGEHRESCHCAVSSRAGINMRARV